MDVLIHDVNNIENFLKINHDEIIVISNDGNIKPCVCCFGCWIKTPGKCVIDDGYNNMGILLSKCNRIIVISQCFYGGYSPFVKNVFDRSIPYLLPYFKIKNGETHHIKRYNNAITLSVNFYGEITNAEKETAKKLIVANGNNMFIRTEIHFYNTFKEIQGV